MNLKSFTLITLFLCSFIYIQAQTSPGIQWQYNLGTNERDGIFSVQQTTDGGYVTAGFGNTSALFNLGRVVKMKFDGTVQWEKYLSLGSVRTSATSIQQTIDGGYIVGAVINDRLPDGVPVNDSWVIKLNSTGDTVWSKRLGGSINEAIYSIQQTSDGGYIFTGYANSTDGDVTGNHGNYDFWVVKLSGIGAVEWKQCYGGSEWDEGRCIRQTTDGGYIVSGLTRSIDGDVTGYHTGGSEMYDAWILKLNAAGVIEWQKCLGGSAWDESWSIVQSSDGGYLVAGNAESTNGDVTGNHGSFDIWIVKLSNTGNILWKKTFGGSSADLCYAVRNTTDGGYIIAGSTYSTDGDILGNHGIDSDYWILKLNNTGNLEWQKCLGGTATEAAFDVCQTSDNGYFTGGFAASSDGDLTVAYGSEDSWVVKLGSLPLPVMLTRFNAQKQNENILLSWQTATEINSKYFIVERSTNEKDFEVMLTIGASGNTLAAKNYTCIDAHPFNGINYYRLKQVDNEGNFIYSKTVVINMGRVGSSTVYPNPALNTITIIPKSKLKAVSIINVEGKIVTQLKPSPNNQYNIFQLPKGLYSISLSYADGSEILSLIKN